jgi:hypothetical protein
MVKRSQDSFIKRQKEIKRKQKAQEKMARRQGKKEQARDDDQAESEIIPN